MIHMLGKLLIVSLSLACANAEGQTTLQKIYHSAGQVEVSANPEEGLPIPHTRLVIVGKTHYLTNTTAWLPKIKHRLGDVTEAQVQKSIEDACDGQDQAKSWAASATTASTDGNAIIVCLPTRVSKASSQSGSYQLGDVIRGISPVNDSISVIIVAHRFDVPALATALGASIPDYYPAKHGAVEHMYISLFSYNDNWSQDATENRELSQSMIDSIRQAGTLVDLPANLFNTNAFVNHSRDVAARVGAKVEVLRMEELKKRGFNGIVSVGQAAVEEPALVVLTHEGPDPSKTVALVGKGNVFDTGGLNLKLGNGMIRMKGDLGGAAGVLHAFESLVQNGFQHRLHVILGVAYNALGSKSTRPSDVVKMYSGKVVEIDNIDAEGRLLIGDGAAYAAKDLSADLILTMATLTGSVGGAIGSNHAGILSNKPDLTQATMDAGRQSSDQSYPLIFCPELHFQSLKGSVVADMKNIGGSPGASTAGLFVGAQFDFDRPWIHVDMASVNMRAERGTGYGVALVNTLFGKWTNNTVLQGIGPELKV